MARVLLASLAVASATLELTTDNFDKEVFQSGKAAFVKFLAPWCGHCKSMKPDWDKLADEFKGSDKVLIADVDCTASNAEPLCSRFNVEGFPTIKSFAPPDDEGEDYEGGRDFASLKSHAESLGPGCSADNKAACSAEDLKALEALLTSKPEALQAELDELKEKIKKASEDHEELVKGLQEKYEQSEAATKKVKTDAAPRMKMLRAALASSSSNKDEV